MCAGRSHRYERLLGKACTRTTSRFYESYVQELLRDAHIVYHLADIVAGVDYVFDNQAFVFRQNLLINTNVLAACRTNGIRNYIYVGTACSFPQHLQMVPLVRHSAT